MASGRRPKSASRSKHHVERELLIDFIRVGGKQQLLFKLVEVRWDNPEGIICDVLYPLIGKERLLSMRLLQPCVVYINTLMAQELLAEPGWQRRMTTEDCRALTPLFYGHVNPYSTNHFSQRMFLTA